MSVKIRLRRLGAKKRPVYRLVAIDSRRAREGRFLEILGQYNPIVRPASLTIDQTKVFKWLQNGAEPSETVQTLFSQIGLNEKWALMRSGKDASAVEIRTTISERKKRTRKAKKAAVAEEGAKAGS